MTKTANRRGDGFIRVVKGPDGKGVVAAISGFLAKNDGSISKSTHFNDAVADQF
jgi:formyltetrahydrofolate deformylase